MSFRVYATSEAAGCSQVENGRVRSDVRAFRVIAGAPSGLLRDFCVLITSKRMNDLCNQ